jgi:nucleotide-binding universal stress UspA family protein
LTSVKRRAGSRLPGGRPGSTATRALARSKKPVLLVPARLPARFGVADAPHGSAAAVGAALVPGRQARRRPGKSSNALRVIKPAGTRASKNPLARLPQGVRATMVAEALMYQRILVPLDGSSTAERGLHEAIRLAAGTAAQIELLHVVDDFPGIREFAAYDLLEQARRERELRGEAALESAVALAEAAGVKATAKVLFVVTDLSDTIIARARRARCDAIVMGTHGRSGLSRAVLGSVAEGVARRSPVPVLLVPPLAEPVAG